MKKDMWKKEEIAEDFCFTCKDGGHLLVCDYKNCLKAYHPSCVDKEPSFLDTDERWTCSWHSCLICQKSSTFQCFCCPSSICRSCIKAAEFVQVKKKSKGFCNNCLRLAIMIEEDKDVDSDGGKVDFKDTETYEFLFKDYWEIVKDQEGLTLVDLHAANALLKRGHNCQSGSDSEKFHDEEYMEEADDLEDNDDGRISIFEGLKGKRGRRIAPTKKFRSKKKTFVGWGSKELIGFLQSIGKYSEQPLSQLDVCEIVKDYAETSNLLHPHKKKKTRKIVVCDDKLHCLFKKKKLKPYRIFDLLESHFAENAELDAEFSFSSEEEDGSILCKKRQKQMSDYKPIDSDPIHTRKGVLAPHKCCYASIVANNIKAIYLKKSLILDLLQNPETFEDKIIGCFVRVKNDPKDFYYLPQKMYQLGQVRGIKKTPHAYKLGEKSTDIVLQISNMAKDIHVSMLSDDDFEEEECEDLRLLVKKGHFKRPTVAEFDRKIRSVHGDIINHWINKEIVRLQKQIERANEKGWRKELHEYIDRRELLRSPEEQMRLVKEIPEVIADIEEIEESPSTLLNFHEEKRGNRAAYLENDAEGKLEGGLASRVDAPLPEAEAGIGAISIETAADEAVGASSSVPGQLDFGIEQQESREALSNTKSNMVIEIEEDEEGPRDKRQPEIQIIDLDEDDENIPDTSMGNEPTSADACEEIVQAATPENHKAVWHYTDPSGAEQGPFTLSSLGYWKEGGFFDDDFKVWRTGQSQEDAILLTEALALTFP